MWTTASVWTLPLISAFVWLGKFFKSIHLPVQSELTTDAVTLTVMLGYWFNPDTPFYTLTQRQTIP